MLTEPALFKEAEAVPCDWQVQGCAERGTWRKTRPELHSADAQGSALLYRQGQRSDNSVTEGDTS